MRKGKMCAQAAHASMKVILDQMHGCENCEGTRILSMAEEEPLYHWINGLFTKVVVGCDSEEELLDLVKKAEEGGVLHALIQDAGKTEFHGVKTYTALAIGPDEYGIIDSITGNLKLL